AGGSTDPQAQRLAAARYALAPVDPLRLEQADPGGVPVSIPPAGPPRPRESLDQAKLRSRGLPSRSSVCRPPSFCSTDDTLGGEGLGPRGPATGRGAPNRCSTCLADSPSSSRCCSASASSPSSSSISRQGIRSPR